jgi:hypothetical protein
MSYIELVFNKGQDGLYGSGSKESTSFDLFSTINSVMEPFIKFWKARLRLCVLFHRVHLTHPHEEDPTFARLRVYILLNQIVLSWAVKIFDQLIWHPANEAGLDKLKNAQIKTGMCVCSGNLGGMQNVCKVLTLIVLTLQSVVQGRQSNSIS